LGREERGKTEMITTGLGAGSYPEPKKEGEQNREEENPRWVHRYAGYFQQFSDSREFRRSFEGETWFSLSREEQREIIRSAMKIYSAARDCDGWKGAYLRKYSRDFRDFLRDEIGEEWI
jgi:hypothetical protein